MNRCLSCCALGRGHPERRPSLRLRRAAEARTRDEQLRAAAAEDEGASPSAAARARREAAMEARAAPSEGCRPCHGGALVAAPAAKPQLAAETAIRRIEQMRAGPVPAGRCAACPPFFKHTPHTCAAKRRVPAEGGGSEAEAGGCPACAPLLRHVAHTCGRSYVGKRYGRKRKQPSSSTKVATKVGDKGRPSPTDCS